MEGSYYFLLFLFLYLITKHFLHKLKKLPPSPSIELPIIGHLHLFKKPLHKTLAKLSEKHGPVIFLKLGSRPVLVVTSPSIAEECFTKNDIAFANRPRLLAGKHLGYDYTTLTWAPYGHHWRNLRRIASLEILSTNRIQMFESIRSSEIQSLMWRLSTGSQNGNYVVVDMKASFFEMTLNIMMRMIAGKRYYGDNVAEVEEARKFKKMVTETFELSGASNIVDFVPFMKWFDFNRIEDRLKVLKQTRDNLMQELIEEHKRRIENDVYSNLNSEKTMIDVLLSLQESEPEYYNDKIIRGIMQVMLSAGTDTSAGTMEWALSLLLNNPDALIKARLEIETYTAGKNRLIQDSDLSDLPYLNGIINETLRMYPAAPVLVPHESSEVCTLGGFNVPGGTMLLVNLWAMQNDPKLWEKANRFKPERFMNGEVGVERDLGFKFIPFGFGRRGCPGEGLAMRVVGLAIGRLVQCFEWKRVSEDMVDMSEGGGLTMPKANPLLAKCRPFESMLHLITFPESTT